MMSSASELISFRVRSSVLKANNAMTNQKEILEKILVPLTEERIDISGIDLVDMKLDREAALALQREVLMMAESREEAQQRMIERAEEIGANAITDIRFTTSMVMSNTSEILAYGTAVMAVRS